MISCLAVLVFFKSIFRYLWAFPVGLSLGNVDLRIYPSADKFKAVTTAKLP